MDKPSVMKKYTLALLLAAVGLVADAAPWVEANDIHLRADIQQLADHNIIKAPINRWPISWIDIAADFDAVDLSELSPALAESYRRVLFHYKNAKFPVSYTSIQLKTSTEAPRFSHFGESGAERGGLLLEKGFVSNRFAGQLSLQAVQEASDDKRYRWDGSYLAYNLGNWSVTLGAVPMWWGPGWDSALLMSSNARPVPGISLSRHHAVAFASPYLSWLGPWSFTTFMGQLEERGRTVPNTRLWSSRLTLRPLPALEIGLSRSTMWAGDGRAKGLSAFWDIVTPSESDNEINNDQDVNDLGAVDFRWNTQLSGQPFGLYYEMGFEDYGISEKIPSKRSHLIGIDSDFHFDETLLSLYLEASDTYHETCQCIYEHDIYKTGYRHRDKVIGSTYGSNANSVTLGVLGQHYGQGSWQASIRWLELNKQNEDNSTAKVKPYQEIWELDTRYRFIYWNSQWILGSTYRHTEIRSSSEQDLEFSLSWKYLM